MSEKTIEIYKIRDFSAKFNATIEYIRQNFAALVKVCLLIAAPLGLLFGILMSNMFQSTLSYGQNAAYMDESEALNFLGNVGSYSMLMVLISVISYSLLMAGIFGYMRLKHENGVAPTVEETYRFALSKLGGIIVILIISYFISFIGFIAFFIPGLYLIIVFSLSVPVFIFEDISIGEAISRPFKLIKDKWWSTFGLLFISGIIAGVVSYVFAIPFYILVMAEAFAAVESGDPESIFSVYSGWKSAASMGFLMIGSFITYMIPLIALAFQYTNLRERREAIGLRSQIKNFDELG